MASLSEVQANWEGFAQMDPLWAICVDDQRRGGRWTKDEFFATGEREITKLLQYLESLGLTPLKTSAALDFGCGVGRLTRALSGHFDKCWGVDISPTMIRLAKSFNENPYCTFSLNEGDTLGQFPDEQFGFIYTSITLQHIPMHYVRKYLLEFVRILRPGGIFVFQVPDHANLGLWQKVEGYLGLKRRIKRLMRFLMGNSPATLRMDMNCFPQRKIKEVFSSLPVRIVDVQFTNSAQGSFNGDLQFLDREPEVGWVSKQYCLVKLP